MRNIVVLVCLVFVLGGFAFGQGSNCPKIEVSGPSGLVDTGKKATFTVQVGAGEWDSKISYFWSTSSGAISAGQGTRTIEVVVDRALTATVEIKGLPEGCPNQTSDTMFGDSKPEAVKLSEFAGSLDKIAKERFAEIVEAAKADPNAQLYILISGGVKNPTVSISRKRVVILDQFSKRLHDYRVTFVNSNKNDDRVLIYLVPAGADIPRID